MNNTRGKSKNPNGRYLWLRTQIGSMLKNQTYLGHVVSGKREQISPKLKKGIQKSKEEFIVVKNMHEPIIDEELWNKVQEKLKSYNTDNRKKYDYILKDLVYCSECGSKAVFCHNKSKTKSGRVCWEGNHARCSKQNDYKSLCNNKVIGERVLLDTVKEVIIKELESIEYTTKELKEIYEKAERKVRSTIKTIEDKIKEKNKELSVIQEKATELYRKKLSKSIEIEKFTEQYKKINEEKENIIMQLNELQEQKKKTKTKDTKSRSEINKIKKIVNEFLSMENPDREIVKKLVERIEFDKNKNITIKLTFSNPYKEKKWYIEQFGIHTVNHKSMPSISDEEIEREIMQLHQAVYEKFNYEMKYMRPPKGEFNERTLKKTEELGYKTVMWSFAYMDWDENKQPTIEESKEMIINNFHCGEIMLLHPNSKTNSEVLDTIIKEAKNQGYEFKLLDQFK